MAPTSTASRPTPTVRLRKVDQFPALRSVETNEQTRTLAWKQVRPRSSINNDEIEPESTHDGGYDFARAVGSCRRWPLRSRSIRQHNRGAGRMNDVYIIESWFGERRNVRHVYAADADDALQTHALHYPGERILSVQRGDGLSVR
jgi:hypothetical protein